jgi:hypothetical protein
MSHSGRNLLMSGLDQQSPDTTDEGRHITDNGPGNRLGSEKPGIAPVPHRVLERIGRMRKEPGSGADYASLYLSNDRH